MKWLVFVYSTSAIDDNYVINICDFCYVYGIYHGIHSWFKIILNMKYSEGGNFYHAWFQERETA